MAKNCNSSDFWLNELSLRCRRKFTQRLWRRRLCELKANKITKLGMGHYYFEGGGGRSWVIFPKKFLKVRKKIYATEHCPIPPLKKMMVHPFSHLINHSQMCDDDAANQSEREARACNSCQVRENVHDQLWFCGWLVNINHDYCLDWFTQVAYGFWGSLKVNETTTQLVLNYQLTR